MAPATQRALTEEREHLSERLRNVRFIGAVLWVASVVLAAESTQELTTHVVAPSVYLAVAVALIAAARIFRRPAPWSLWVVPLFDVPTVLFIEYARVATSPEKLGNAMYALALFAFMVLMALLTLKRTVIVAAGAIALPMQVWL